ncbi:MAG: hypothetical protein FJ280_15050 [Planctomycetes bacterium]|nr:hypothetical protein [Planctomycetota bacterium]
MTVIKRLVTLALAAALALGGCATPAPPPDTVADGADRRETTARRFQEGALEGRTAVTSAIELSERYARLSDQTVTLRQENQRLTTDNEALRQQIAAVEAKLKQTQKELGEANDLLIEMLTELNTWKSNILGFRGEMRQAAQAQLEALLKVLEILGGQAEAGTLERRHAETLHPDTSERAQARSSAGPQEREPNGTP